MDNDELMLNKARKLAIKFHSGQKRRNGDDYVTHPIRVSESMIDPIEKIVAMLHDILEDTKCTEKDLKNAGFNEKIITAVKTLTRKKNETYFDFIFKIRNKLSSLFPVFFLY